MGRIADLLLKSYLPPQDLDRFQHRGDAAGARCHFEATRPSNLGYLLKRRFLG
jgi:hypothetical protein